jgi:thioesterase domain-containing protein
VELWPVQFIARSVTHAWQLPRIPFGQRLEYMRSKWHMGRRRFVRHDPEEVASTMSTPVAAESDYLRTLIRYRARPWSGQLTLIISDEYHEQNRAVYDWRRWVQGGLTTLRVPGTHNSYIREHAQSTAEILRGCLERAERAQVGEPDRTAKGSTSWSPVGDDEADALSPSMRSPS